MRNLKNIIFDISLLRKKYENLNEEVIFNEKIINDDKKNDCFHDIKRYIFREMKIKFSQK